MQRNKGEISRMNVYDKCGQKKSSRWLAEVSNSTIVEKQEKQKRM